MIQVLLRIAFLDNCQLPKMCVVVKLPDSITVRWVKLFPNRVSLAWVRPLDGWMDEWMNGWMDGWMDG